MHFFRGIATKKIIDNKETLFKRQYFEEIKEGCYFFFWVVKEGCYY
jgi:hypothetical protein